MALIENWPRVRGKPAYRVRVKYRGRVLSATHSDLHSAERWAAEIGANIRDDAHFAGESNRRRTLADLIDRYVAHVLPEKGNARSQRVHQGSDRRPPYDSFWVCSLLLLLGKLSSPIRAGSSLRGES